MKCPVHVLFSQFCHCFLSVSDSMRTIRLHDEVVGFSGWFGSLLARAAAVLTCFVAFFKRDYTNTYLPVHILFSGLNSVQDAARTYVRLSSQAERHSKELVVPVVGANDCVAQSRVPSQHLSRDKENFVETPGPYYERVGPSQSSRHF